MILVLDFDGVLHPEIVERESELFSVERSPATGEADCFHEFGTTCPA